MLAYDGAEKRRLATQAAFAHAEEKGREEGLAEGIEQGKHEEKLDNVLKMLQKGILTL